MPPCDSVLRDDGRELLAIHQTDRLLRRGDGDLDDTVRLQVAIPTQVFGRGGKDRIDGGSSGDQLFGGSGNDRLFGHDGDDLLHGNAGDDVLVGGDGTDQFFGADGADRISSRDGIAENVQCGASSPRAGLGGQF